MKEPQDSEEWIAQQRQALAENPECATTSYNLGVTLMKEEKFEEAINELSKLKDGERYGRESREMIERSIDEFARQKRGEAAKLFLMAKKTADPAEKRTLLLKSFELLKEVIKKYPTSSYSAKIIKNIAAVKQEIREVDPQFAPEKVTPD